MSVVTCEAYLLDLLNVSTLDTVENVSIHFLSLIQFINFMIFEN